MKEKKEKVDLKPYRTFKMPLLILMILLAVLGLLATALIHWFSN